MPITKLTVENFKGIAAATEFEIRPITIFLGANSSGKSSCIHALTALAQTLKLGNSTPSLVLDDDYAHVHLGRFIEIAHSKTYAEAIKIGVDVGDVFLGKFNKDDDDVQGNCRANYSFRSTMRTQEVYVESAQISVGPVSVSIKRGTKAPYAFSASIEPGKDRLLVDRANNFIFRSRYEQLSDSKLSGPQRSALLRTFFMLESSQKHIERILRETLYLGPFRQSPLRRYPFRGMSAAEVGPQGEATITMLAGEYVQAQDRPHVKQINTWLTAMNLAKNVDLARVGTSDLFDVKLTLPDGNKLPIADLGYGLSQVLPVLTQCTFAPQSSTLLFEQPELHLHENAAKKLAGVFHETAKKKQAHIVLETHSKELVYEFLQLLKTKKLAVEDLAIYMVQRKDGASNYKRVGLELDEAGNLEVSDPWVKALTEH